MRLKRMQKNVLVYAVTAIVDEAAVLAAIKVSK
jgi:hypothetical protein